MEDLQSQEEDLQKNSEVHVHHARKKFNKKIIKYVFIAAIVLVVVGFFQTFEGYKPQPPQDDNVLPPEQLEAIKAATEDEENLEILGDASMIKKSTFDPTKLSIEDIKYGGGEEVKSGDTVEVHYTGTLIDGKKFDSSLDRGQPFSFTVGAGQVIQGWEQGLLGMKIGGRRKLTIPPHMGYGAQGVPGAIPSNAVLIFEIELLDIKKSE